MGTKYNHNGKLFNLDEENILVSSNVIEDNIKYSIGTIRKAFYNHIIMLHENNNTIMPHQGSNKSLRICCFNLGDIEKIHIIYEAEIENASLYLRVRLVSTKGDFPLCETL